MTTAIDPVSAENATIEVGEGIVAVRAAQAALDVATTDLWRATDAVEHAQRALEHQRRKLRKLLFLDVG